MSAIVLKNSELFTKRLFYFPPKPWLSLISYNQRELLAFFQQFPPNRFAGKWKRSSATEFTEGASRRPAVAG
jgi:hypothetical protein